MTIYLNASQTLQSFNTAIDGVTNSYNTHASNNTLHLTTAQNTWIDAITVTSAEVNCLTGVTANIQLQLDSLITGTTASAILTKIKTVDGTGSGLDAGLLQSKALSAAGARWDVIPYVQADGVIELGSVIDFHETTADVADSTARITVSGGDMSFSGSLTVTGNISSLSDASIKQNIVEIESPIAKVLQLVGVYYDNTLTQKRNVGLIAQNVQQIIPEAVEMTDDGLLSVSYGNLVGLLIEAIKELSNEVEILKVAK